MSTMATKQQRKTELRKARQHAALALLKRVNPQGAFVRGPLGSPLPLIDPSMLRETSKQKLVEGYEKLRHR